MQLTFQSHIRFARTVQKYGDAFSKSSSLYCPKDNGEYHVYAGMTTPYIV